MLYRGQRKLIVFLVLLTFLGAGILVGCSARNSASSASAAESQRVEPGEAAEATGGTPTEVIRVAKQFGLVYAPLMVAEKMDFFSKYGLKVEWMTLGSGGAVREALAANELDVAFMGIPPFLIGWDKGITAKICAGYVVSPVSLVTYDPNIKTIKDFKPEHKIALPSPGSIQHILLAMALEKEVGNANALDDNLVALPHPDGAQALIGKRDIVAHFTTPPSIIFIYL